MLSIRLIFVVLALVCLFLASLNFATTRVSFGWLGLFFWLLSTVVT